MRTRSGTTTAVAAAAVLALALAGCGDQRADSGDEGPPPLAIGSALGIAGASLDADAEGSRSSGPGGFTLDGPLPDGPASAVVLRYDDDTVDVAQVSALASALGLPGEPTRAAHGWELSGAGLLRVRDDGEWSFSRVGLPCPAYAVDVSSPDGGGGVSCASAEPAQPGDPAVASDLDPVGDQGSTPPQDADALAAAQPVLAAAGVDGAPRVQTWPGSSTASVLVDPTVAGLATSGIRTTVDVDDDGVVGALGRLGDPAEGPAYPILSAQETFDRLTAMPVPLPAIACPESVEGQPNPCPTPTPMSVTGAVLGLQLAFDAGDAVLVPAWLFDVAGSDEPVAMVAVVDDYLTDPTGGDDPTSGSGSSGSDPGSGGASDTPVAPPSDPGSGGGSAPDPGTAPEPVPGGEPLTAPVERAIVDGRTLTLIGWGGACADYTAVADESADAVKVQIVGKSTIGPDQACIEIAVELRLEVALAAPLGDRAVLDATTGTRVPVTR
jgi:hypothetical protein